MSDDDLVRRGDVRALIVRTGMSDGDYFAEKLDTVPAASSSASAPAERLARAADADAAAYAAFAAAISRGEDWRPFDAPATKSREEFMSALAAFRAAPEPAPVNDVSISGKLTGAEPASFQKPPGFLDEAAVRANNPEPANPDPCVCGRCPGLEEPPAEPAKPEPCRTCGGGGERLLWSTPVLGGVMTTTAPCPSCRPGGGA